MPLRSNVVALQHSAAEQAAAWFARHRAGPLSDAEEAEFAAWLKGDPTRPEAWATCERLWMRLEIARDDPRVLTVRESAKRRMQRGVAWTRARTVLGSAAAAGLMAVLGWMATQHPLIPDRVEAALGRPPGEASSDSSLVRSATTEVGERSLLVLPDGSRVMLNTASAVRSVYSAGERRVTLLRGQAFFDVAKDPSRPFIVTAGSREVVAVGTAFDVRLTDQQVRVTLVEGKVRIVPLPRVGTTHTPPVPIVNLDAGSALTAQDDGPDRVGRVDTARATNWRTGRLVFDGERLADVVAEMNRYSHEQLVIADRNLDDRRVSGVFDAIGGRAFARDLEAYGLARAIEDPTNGIALVSP